MPLTVSFFDEDGLAVTPSSATYRIDRPAQKRNILPATAFPSLAASVDILITGNENQIYRERNEFEIQEVTVVYNYAGALGPMQGTNKFRYKILNLYGVVNAASASQSPSASASPSV